VNNAWKWAKRTERMQRSTIREILKLTKQKDMISFAGGLPAPESFPLEAFAEAMAKTFREDGVSALQYDVTEGYPPLKEFLCRWLSRHGIHCTPDHLMLTNGSQQALDLIGKVFLDPGDRILVEEPTYLGAIQAFNAYEAAYVSTPMDDEGILIAGIEQALKRKHPKIAYLVPTFQNPSGITMSPGRRLAVLKALRPARIPIIEDDPYGYLRFHGTPAPSLYSLARGKGVIYLSTFSKILSPGIRMGFVVSEPAIIHALVMAKQAADLQPNSLIQRAVYHYGESGHLDKHIPNIIEIYRKRAVIMMQAMRQHFPPEVRWVEPQGGMFIWCTLPAKISASRLFRKAIANKVAYVTGSVFYANGGGDNTFRLNFTNCSETQIRIGIERLGAVLRSAIR
jgi:2-aminoadipate transaminase